MKVGDHDGKTDAYTEGGYCDREAEGRLWWEGGGAIATVKWVVMVHRKSDNEKGPVTGKGEVCGCDEVGDYGRSGGQSL